ARTRHRAGRLDARLRIDGAVRAEDRVAVDDALVDARGPVGRVERVLLDPLLLKEDLGPGAVLERPPVVVRLREQIDAADEQRLARRLAAERGALMEHDLARAADAGGPLEDARPGESQERAGVAVVGALFVLEALDPLVA